MADHVSRVEQEFFAFWPRYRACSIQLDLLPNGPRRAKVYRRWVTLYDERAHILDRYHAAGGSPNELLQRACACWPLPMELKAAVYETLRSVQPALVHRVEALVRRGEPAARIGAFVSQESEFLGGVVEMAAEYLAEAHTDSRSSSHVTSPYVERDTT